ncbi:carbohydrate ABC transporter permease [Kocuria flava]|uniref:carbohydrate ABC transporter permease n=1 Tax=Kocuria flava TaxID=446860 RepID=UPI000C79D473|nr:sugar ABC transporter permease [Kocuria flava]
MTVTTQHTRERTGARETTGAAPEPGPRPRGSRPLLAYGHGSWALPGILLVLAVHYAATSIGGFFAFTDWSGIGSFNWVGLANFEQILQDPTKIGAVLNTLFLAFGSVILTNVLGLLLALSLNRGLRTRFTLRVLFFMPVVLSQLAVAYIWKFIFDYNGPLNQGLAAVGLEHLQRPWLADPDLAIWAVLGVVTWQNIGFAMVIYLAGLASVPVEIEEAAALDGASLWQRFWAVTVPSIRPAIAIATTIGLVNGLRIFDQIMALTAGGPAGATETLATEVYKQAFSLGRFGYGAALALILTVVILVFAVVQQRVTRDRSQEA